MIVPSFATSLDPRRSCCASVNERLDARPGVLVGFSHSVENRGGREHDCAGTGRTVFFQDSPRTALELMASCRQNEATGPEVGDGGLGRALLCLKLHCPLFSFLYSIQGRKGTELALRLLDRLQEVWARR